MSAIGVHEHDQLYLLMRNRHTLLCTCNILILLLNNNEVWKPVQLSWGHQHFCAHHHSWKRAKLPHANRKVIELPGITTTAESTQLSGNSFLFWNIIVEHITSFYLSWSIDQLKEDLYSKYIVHPHIVLIRSIKVLQLTYYSSSLW